MKPRTATILLLCLVLALTACAAPANTVIKTTIGDLNIASTKLASQVHDVTAPDGYTILLIALARVDGKELPLEDLVKAQTDGRVVLLGEDNAPYVCTMGGLLEDGSMVLGCPIPTSFKKVTLSWDGNSPIEITLPTK